MPLPGRDNYVRLTESKRRHKALKNRLVALLSVIANPGRIGARQSHAVSGFLSVTCCFLRSPRRYAPRDDIFESYATT